MSNAHVNHKHGMVKANQLRPKSPEWKKRNKAKARERKAILLRQLEAVIQKASAGLAIVAVLVFLGCARQNPLLQETVEQPTTVEETVQPMPVVDVETAAPEAPEPTPAPAEPREEPASEPVGEPAVEPTEEAPTMEEEAPDEMEVIAPQAPSVKTFIVEARQFSFTPSTITVKRGDIVRLSATAFDVAHGLAIPAYNINATLPPNQTQSIEFVADKAGTFPFACSVFCGAGHGTMRGTLIVEE